jgi:hypothetical protein
VINCAPATTAAYAFIGAGRAPRLVVAPKTLSFDPQSPGTVLSFVAPLRIVVIGENPRRWALSQELHALLRRPQPKKLIRRMTGMDREGVRPPDAMSFPKIPSSRRGFLLNFLASLRGISSATRFRTRWRRTGWLRREDSNLCISELDPLLSIMA